jgi:hypothetical protein
MAKPVASRCIALAYRGAVAPREPSAWPTDMDSSIAAA